VFLLEQRLYQYTLADATFLAELFEHLLVLTGEPNAG
jgi:hypothetical protein